MFSNWNLYDILKKESYIYKQIYKKSVYGFQPLYMFDTLCP